jgi:hypothetical protein
MGRAAGAADSAGRRRFEWGLFTAEDAEKCGSSGVISENLRG